VNETPSFKASDPFRPISSFFAQGKLLETSAMVAGSALFFAIKTWLPIPLAGLDANYLWFFCSITTKS